MIQEAIYTNDEQVLKVSVEKCEVLRKSNEILQFPFITELEGDQLVLTYGYRREGATPSAAISNDFGQTWVDAPSGFPMADAMHAAGIIGYLRDGTIALIDVNRTWRKADGPYHIIMRVDEPTFRIRRFSKKAKLLEDSTFKVLNIPWKTASYQCYSTLLELENGDFLTAFQAQIVAPAPPERRLFFTTFMARSIDRGKTFEHVWTFYPQIDGKLVGDQGFCEPDMEVLANGDILCILRTGGGSVMYQSRSTDGGRTWSEPMSIGWPGVRPHLRLLSNGVLACSAGRGHYGHPQITYAMFSIDGTGKVWEYPFAFHTGASDSYTWNMERGGKFYVVYSHYSHMPFIDHPDVPFWPLQLPAVGTSNSIKRVVLDVEKNRRR